MLYRSRFVVPGWCVEVTSSPFAPPEVSGMAGASGVAEAPRRPGLAMGEEAYRQYLEGYRRRSPWLFERYVQSARDHDITVIGRWELTGVLCEVLVAVAQAKGWGIDGGVWVGSRERTRELTRRR